jgi:hypothetical protein
MSITLGALSTTDRNVPAGTRIEMSPRWVCSLYPVFYRFRCLHSTAESPWMIWSRPARLVPLCSSAGCDDSLCGQMFMPWKDVFNLFTHRCHLVCTRLRFVFVAREYNSPFECDWAVLVTQCSQLFDESTHRPPLSRHLSCVPVVRSQRTVNPASMTRARIASIFDRFIV